MLHLSHQPITNQHSHTLKCLASTFTLDFCLLAHTSIIRTFIAWLHTLASRNLILINMTSSVSLIISILCKYLSNLPKSCCKDQRSSFQVKFLFLFNFVEWGTEPRSFHVLTHSLESAFLLKVLSPKLQIEKNKKYVTICFF